MTRETASAIFIASGIEILKIWEVPNQYWPRPVLKEKPLDHEIALFVDYHRLREQSPWWLIKTPFGMIEIGDRKRVIAIDWSDTRIVADVTADEVTKWNFGVHAWSNAKAVEYLSSFSRIAKERIMAESISSSAIEMHKTCISTPARG